MTNVFNPCDYEHALTEAGVAPEQAAVHAKALGHVLSEVAFCKDLNIVESNVRHEIGQSEQRLILRIEAVHTELSARINKVRTELDARIERVETGLIARIERVETGLIARIESVRSELNARIERVETELIARIEHVETELNAKIDKVWTALNARIGILDARAAAVERELVIHRWLFGLVVTLQMATLGLVIRLTLP
jgi:hypothetical protein